MRALLLSCLLVPQGPGLDLPTSVVAGVPMRVRAAPTPIAGIRVELLDANGQAREWRAASTAGDLEFSIAEPGAYTLRWLAPDGTEVLAPFHELAPRPSWFSAWWTVPVGLLLAGLGLRRALTERVSAR
jgi:hypothetical protein